MRKSLLIAIFAPLLLILIITAYIWYSSKKQVDAVLQQWAIFATVKYASLWVSPFGTLSLHDIRITPQGSYSDFTIATLRLTTPSLWTLFNLEEDLRRGNLPASIELSAQRIEVPIYLLPLDAAAASANPSFEALGCGDINAFATDEYLAMGYETFVIDQTLSYQYDENKGRLLFNSNSSMRDSAAIVAEFELASLPQDGGPLVAPKFVRGQLSYIDQSFNQRRNQFCAKKTGIAIEQFIDEHVRLASLFLQQNGVAPSEGMVTAYREFIRTHEGARVDLQFTPSSALDLSELALQPPQQLLQFLQPSIIVNDVAVDNIALSFSNDFTGFGFASETPQIEKLESDTNPDSNPNQAEPLGSLTPGGSFHKIQSNEVNGHLGKPAVVTVVEGKAYEGKIIDAHKTALQIEVSMLGGSVAYWLDYNNINEIQVYY